MCVALLSCGAVLLVLSSPSCASPPAEARRPSGAPSPYEGPAVPYGRLDAADVQPFGAAGLYGPSANLVSDAEANLRRDAGTLDAAANLRHDAAMRDEANRSGADEQEHRAVQSGGGGKEERAAKSPGSREDPQGLERESTSHAGHARAQLHGKSDNELGQELAHSPDKFGRHKEKLAAYDSQNEADSTAADREKRSSDDRHLQTLRYDPLTAWQVKRYDDPYLQNQGYDPVLAWIGKRYDDSYLQSIGYDPTMAWGKKRYDDSFLQSIGYDPTMAWGNKRYDDSFLQSVGYDPTMAWGKKRYDDSFLQSIGYDPSMAWGKRRYDDSVLQSAGYDPTTAWGNKRDGYDEYNPLNSYRSMMNKNSKNTDAPNENDDGEDEVETPETYFQRGSINVEPILTKRSIRPRMFIGVDDYKRSPSEMGPRGFHEGIFNDHFGYFSPVKRSKRGTKEGSYVTSKEDSTQQADEKAQRTLPAKRKFGMGARGFHGDTFSSGFGDFGTMKKRYHGMTSSGFHGDTFSSGFGDFGTMKKRYNDMTSSGFHGDTFSSGFGDFGTMKKRYHGMTSSGFHGDTFSSGFGDFGTMKKRYLGMTSSGFHGDTFSGGFGDFGTMKKRFPLANPSEYSKGDVNHRLDVMLNSPNILRENVGVTSANMGNNLRLTELLPSQVSGRAGPSNDDDDSR